MGGRLLCALFVMTLLVAASQQHVWAEEPKPADRRLRPEDKALFAWWDSLEYADVRSLPFVKLTTGGWTRVAGEDANGAGYGFGKWTAVPDAGCAPVADGVKTKRLQVLGQAGFVEVAGDNL